VGPVGGIPGICQAEQHCFFPLLPLHSSVWSCLSPPSDLFLVFPQCRNVFLLQPSSAFVVWSMDNLAWYLTCYRKLGDRGPSFESFRYSENKDNLLYELQWRCLVLFSCILELDWWTDKSTQISNTFSYLFPSLT